MKIIYIDGYNVINSWPQLIEAKKVSYDIARQKLIEILENYSSYKGNKVVIVFDAHLVKGSIQKKEKHGNLMIVFTKEGETADSYIEKAVNDLGRKVDISVVTNDNLEQQLVFQRGATRKSCLDFYHEVNSIENRIRKKTEVNSAKDRNLLEDYMDDDLRQKFEKMRTNR